MATTSAALSPSAAAAAAPPTTNTNNNNARHTIERLLTSETCSGKYSTGSKLPATGRGSIPIPIVAIVPNDEGGKLKGRKLLTFPLNDADVQTIKDHAERAGVGLIDRTVVNLDVRKTWQIKPQNLAISNVEPALTSALQTIARDLGTETEYQIEAHLYKLLLYEEGCFFARHRDNERLHNMFGTLVLELPSVYEGAELSVWSPLTPNEKMTYTFNGGSGGGGGGEENSGDTGSPSSKRQKKKKNKNRKKNKKNENTNESTLPGLHFAAFYADCYHEVSKLTSGHRVALVYHLTATPLTTRLLPHLPAVPSRPSQPAEESIAIQLAKAIDAFGREGDEAYPSMWSDYVVKQVGSIGKPKKLAVVLSHCYTPASLTGIQSLKGSDRAIAELIRAAAYRSPDNGDVVSDGEPVFDAVVALAVVWDWGECTPTACSWSEKDDESTFYTTGPIISISKGGNKENVDVVPPLNLGPAGVNDREAAYHPSWFGGKEKLGPPYQFEGPFGWEGPEYDTDGPIIYGEQACQNLKVGNHSLPIYSHEILFASEEAAIKFRKDENDHHIHTIVESDPKEIEFLGNGCPYMGRIYSRAVILLWPRANREAIEMQTKGGRAAKNGSSS